MKGGSTYSMELSETEEKRTLTSQMTTPKSSPIVSTQPDKYRLLSPRSRRKTKNRDQMRLARQKERETMQTLRETMHRLETRYQETIARGIVPPTQNSIDSGSEYASSVLDQSVEVVSPSQYVKLMEESARLKHENFRFRQALHEKSKLQDTMERLYDDSHQAPTQEEVNMRNQVFAHDTWTPLANEEVWAYIRTTNDQVAATLQSISRRAALRRLNPSTQPIPPFLGWQVRHHREDEEVLFSFEKSFYHVTALQAMLQTWNNELTMQSYRKSADVATQSMTVFQRINDDSYVFRRQMQLQEQLVTTHYLRFRLKTSSGYAIGNWLVKSKFTSQEDDIWAANLSLWTDFTTRSESDHEYCVVRISGRINVNATETAASRAAVDLIFGLLRWENLNIGPVFTFTAS